MARWITFDCFGTLVDWRHGIATSAELIAPGQGARLLDGYHRHEARVQRETPVRRYRDVLTETLRRAAGDAGIEVSDDDASVLTATIGYWPVFAEVRPVLAELRAAGWRLALLTNCDRDILAQTQRRLGVPFDAVVTAEDVGAYKPAHDHFHRFASVHEVNREQWVHVAQSYFHDIVPARDLGVARIWINRLAEGSDPSRADAVLPNLTDLAATVAAVAGQPGPVA